MGTVIDTLNGKLALAIKIPKDGKLYATDGREFLIEHWDLSASPNSLVKLKPTLMVKMRGDAETEEGEEKAP